MTDLAEVLDGNPSELPQDEKPVVYLVWSIDRVDHKIELCAIASNEPLAKKYARVIRKRGDVDFKDKDLRPKIEKREIDHLFASDMMGDGIEWNKKSGNGLESKKHGV